MSFKDEIQTWDGYTLLMAGTLTLLAVASVPTIIGSQAWAWATNTTPTPPLNPIELAKQLTDGTYANTTIWYYIAAAAALIAIATVGLALAIARTFGKRKRGDAAASLAGRGKNIESLTQKAAKAKAQRFGLKTDAFGLPIGRAVRAGTSLFSDFEAVCTMIAGPRTGKTTSWAVPRIYAAPGAVVATSNKRDILDITRKTRQKIAPVWVFDPQNIAESTQGCWWDPLDYVTNSERAEKLADVFLTASTGKAGDQKNEWENWSCNLIAALLLAAAKGKLPLITLHRWINDQTDDEAVGILRKHHEETSAVSLRGIMDLVPETRSGVYGGASRIMNFLTSKRLMAWATPTTGLPQFNPETFVTTKQSVYLLSQEGAGSAGPLVTALTVAIADAAEAYANRQGGRMPTPMLIELDEAANVCRWRELPDKYSHFGSKGICVDTVLQSWSQGATVWADAGIKKLWSASNVKVYGGGVSEREFLSSLSDLIGLHYIDSQQVSTSPQGRSVSWSKDSQQRPIATVADLQALPAGRAWVFASQAVPTLAKLIPYWEMPQPKTTTK